MKRGIALMTMTALLGMSAPFVYADTTAPMTTATNSSTTATTSANTTTVASPSTIWIVKSGDSLWKISQSTGVPVAQIAHYNGTTNAAMIYVGQGLKIPSIWNVKSGDSLWKIAQATGVSVQSIAQANGITNVDQIQTGSVLIIPSANATYTVQSGDVLWKIAMATGVATQALAKANNLINPDQLVVGQVLIIPTTVSNTSTTGATTTGNTTTGTTTTGTTIKALGLFYNIENIGGPSTVIEMPFIVRDSKGNPISNANIRFSSDNVGIVLPSPLRTRSTNVPIETTDSSGKYTEFFAPGLVKTGTGHVTAYINNEPAHTFALTVVNAVTAINVTETLQNAQSNTWQITAMAYDQNRNPVSGIPLQLQISPTLTQTAYTDNSGKAVFTYQPSAGAQGTIDVMDQQSGVEHGMPASPTSGSSSGSGSNLTSPIWNSFTLTFGYNYKATIEGAVVQDNGFTDEFIPVYYIMQCLEPMGYQVAWNGATQTLTITTPSGVTYNGTGTISNSTGNTGKIIVNGNVVATTEVGIWQDPSSGVRTTYLPIYYINKVLKGLGFITQYNGTTYAVYTA